MLLWIISLLTLAAAAADVIHYRRMRRRAPGLRHRVFIVAAAATDALPAVIAVAGAVARDNTTAFMTFAMWAFWAWMVTVLPRMACYFSDGRDCRGSASQQGQAWRHSSSGALRQGVRPSA